MQPSLSLDALIGIEPLLHEDERRIRDAVRALVADKVLPRVGQAFLEEGSFAELGPDLAELGLLGATLPGPGSSPVSAVGYGLALAELEYGDSALRSFVSVHGSLAMYAIHRFGSDAQRSRWLPAMRAGWQIGCFGLTEPESGSDPASMRMRARRDGSDYLLSGTKLWITSAPIADVCVVFAKLDDGDGPDSVRAFVIERGARGFEAPRIEGKMSLRAGPTGAIVLSDCRVPEDQMLAGAKGLGAPLACLNQARFGVGFGVLGAARFCYETALDHTRNRVQFGVPIAGKQLVQRELVDMAAEIARGTILAFHMGRQKDEGRLSPQQVSLLKKTNVAGALSVARRARALLGANGVLVDTGVVRHMLNLESVYTYEGTDEVHTLILGRALTGLDAF